MIEPRDALYFRELMGDGSRLMLDVVVHRFVSEQPNTSYPDAQPIIVRTAFRARADIAPYPLPLMHQSGGVLRTGDLRIMCAQRLVGATGPEEKAATTIRADIIDYRGNTYRVYDLPAGYPIDDMNTLWTGTLRLLPTV